MSATPQSIAEHLLGRIDWQDSESGFCQCPGESFHTTPNGKRDCRVIVSGAPTISCFHSQCSGEIERANLELRRAIGKLQMPAGAPKVRTPEQIERDVQREAHRQLKLRAAASLKQIVEQFAITPEEIIKTSPVDLTKRCFTEDWRAILHLFQPDDVLWIGRDVYQREFKTVAEWLSVRHCPGNFTCPATFKPGTTSRSNANVLHKRFLVVESDKLAKPEMLAVIQWLRKTLRLRAVVDAGGKSLHGWFEQPALDIEDELKIILPQLGCDPKMFTTSQPCRLPGAVRGGKTCQFLIWLDWEGVNA